LSCGCVGFPFSTSRSSRCSKDHLLETWYEPDLLCYGKIIVELKAVKCLCDKHRAIAHNYLKSTGHRLALLVNFGHYPQLEWERIVR
jgi:GxxExxY protein